MMEHGSIVCIVATNPLISIHTDFTRIHCGSNVSACRQLVSDETVGLVTGFVPNHVGAFILMILYFIRVPAIMFAILIAISS